MLKRLLKVSIWINSWWLISLSLVFWDSLTSNSMLLFNRWLICLSQLVVTLQPTWTMSCSHLWPRMSMVMRCWWRIRKHKIWLWWWLIMHLDEMHFVLPLQSIKFNPRVSPADWTLKICMTHINQKDGHGEIFTRPLAIVSLLKPICNRFSYLQILRVHLLVLIRPSMQQSGLRTLSRPTWEPHPII